MSNFGSAPKTGDYSIVTHVMDEATQEELKLLYAELTANKGVIALLGGKTADGAHLIFGCNKADKTIDVRDIFKDAIALIGGKGGGSACCAQGCGVRSTKLWDAVNGARVKIIEML